MNRAEAEAVLREKLDDGPLIRLAEEVVKALTESESVRRADIYVSGDFRVRAGKVRSARLGVKRGS